MATASFMGVPWTVSVSNDVLMAGGFRKGSTERATVMQKMQHKIRNGYFTITRASQDGLACLQSCRAAMHSQIFQCVFTDECCAMPEAHATLVCLTLR